MSAGAPALDVARLRARWELLAPREKLLVAAAAGLIALAIAWWLLLAPAIRTVREARDQHAELDAQLRHMQRLQQQALQMQAQPKLNPDDAMRQLEQSIRSQLGVSARYSIAGDRVTVTLSNAAPQAVAQWLTQARVNARALPGEAKLTRAAGGGWDGTLVLTLPSR